MDASTDPARDKDFVSFLKTAEPFIRRAGGVKVSAILGRTETGWCVLKARVLTLPNATRPGSQLVVEAGQVKGLRLVLGRSDLQPLLDGLKARRLLLPKMEPRDAAILPDKSGMAPRWDNPRWLPRDSPYDNRPSGWPELRIRLAGAAMTTLLPYDVLEEASERLPPHDPPFRDLIDLAERIGLYDGFDWSQSSHLDVVIRFWARFRVTLPDRKRGGATVFIEAPGGVPPTTKLSVIPRRGEISDRLVVPVSGFRRVPGAPALRQRFVRLAPAGPTDLVLSCGGRTIDRIDVGLPSHRPAAHSVIDPELGHLRECVFGKDGKDQKEAEMFEKGIVWLLSLAGYSAIHYGGKKSVQNAPDLLAFAEGSVVVGECTVDLPDSKKLKLVWNRAVAVDRQVRRTGTVASVWPIMFIGKPRAVVDTLATADREATSRVTLVDQDSLGQIVGLVEQGRELAEIVNLLASLPAAST